MDEVAHDTCEGGGGGGGGMLMNDASVDTSGLGRGGRPIRRGGAFGNTCDDE